MVHLVFQEVVPSHFLPHFSHPPGFLAAEGIGSPLPQSQPSLPRFVTREEVQHWSPVRQFISAYLRCKILVDEFVAFGQNILPEI